MGVTSSKKVVKSYAPRPKRQKPAHVEPAVAKPAVTKPIVGVTKTFIGSGDDLIPHHTQYKKKTTMESGHGEQLKDSVQP